MTPGFQPDWAGLEWDVVVAGSGNAGLVAALSAAEAGARVLLLERAPRHLRGGNTRHTRNIRCVHQADEFQPGPYPYAELWRDLCGVGEGPNSEELASMTVRESESVPGWMSDHGVRWQHALAGTLHLGRTNRFFLGGGKALVNTYFRALARRGVAVGYEAMVDDLDLEGAACRAVLVRCRGSTHRVRTKSLVSAAGGFEANIDWLRRYWGDAAENYIVRGTPHNDGHLLARLYEAGAGRAGQEKGFHAIAVDARAPRFDGGIATRLDTIPFGVVLNRDGRRFHDEGEDVWPKRYATWGRLIAEQPDQIAYSFWDAKVDALFLPPMYGSETSGSIAELADRLGLDADLAMGTISAYNDAVVDGTFDPEVLDGCRTEGLRPPKTHWAQRLDTPPYHAVAIRPGITFTYLGVMVDSTARVLREDGTRFDNVFAAGEIMSGNVLSTGYLGGFGLTIGTVWGRRAGTEAARGAA